MENLLREYMERAFSERGIANQPGPRPVVTISREFGCPSKIIAHNLVAALNKTNDHETAGKWRFVNKEVVEATAKHLELHPNEVNYLISSGGKGLVEDVLASFSPTYVSSHRMKKTITEVVRAIADQGYVVIVGRGGVGVLQHTPQTIHVRLHAPEAWRANEIALSRNITKSAATKMIMEMDQKRKAFIEMMSGEKFDPCLFTMALNCSKLTVDESVDTIIGLMKTKKLIA